MFLILRLGLESAPGSQVSTTNDPTIKPEKYKHLSTWNSLDCH